jgi:hypothetical protein
MNALARIDATLALPRQWVIARFNPKRVEALKDQLDLRKVDFYVPVETVKARCGYMRTRTVERPMLGPYGFIDADQIHSIYWEMMEFSFFHGLMPRGEGYAYEPDWKIEALRLLESVLAGDMSTDEAADRFNFVIGQKVVVKPFHTTEDESGARKVVPAAFGDLRARVIGLSMKKRIRYVEIELEKELFGRKQTVELPADEIEAFDGPAGGHGCVDGGKPSTA